MPKSSMAMRTPSAFNRVSRPTVSSTLCIKVVSVSSKTQRAGSKPLLAESVVYIGDDLVSIELFGRDIDRDGDAMPLALPGCTLVGRLHRAPIDRPARSSHSASRAGMKSSGWITPRVG